MRTIILGILFSLVLFAATAQHKLPSLDYRPQGPVTAAFARYGDIPVDLSTGVPSINVPIYTLSSHGINVPVSISYHASGIKVQDVASPVGLGWVLNAGGIISRSILGQADEYLDFNPALSYRPPFKNTEEFLDYQYDTNPTTWASQMYNVFLNKDIYDYYTDRYYYNLGNGESGIFRRDFTNEAIKFIPYSPNKVRFYFLNGVANNGNLMIEMTTIDGTMYHFKKNIFDLWHLAKIVNKTKTDSVVFYSHYEIIEYNNFNDKSLFGPYKATPGNKTRAELTSGNFSFQTFVDNSSSRIIDGSTYNDEVILIDSIVSSDASIKFSYAMDRQDRRRSGSGAGDPKSRLTKIQVFSKPAGRLIKEVNFTHVYKEEFNANVSKRLMLDRVELGVDREEKYIFKYNQRSLPNYPYFSTTDPILFYEDFWGYCNGMASPTLLCSEFTPEAMDSKYPDEESAKACILEEIQYPTGGKTLFEFESNRISRDFYGYGMTSPRIPADGKVGGLRVKKITTYPYEGAQPQVKQYNYVSNLYDTYGNLGVNLFVYLQTTWNYYDCIEGCPRIYAYTQANVAVAKPAGRYIGTARAPVVYDEVTEYYGDANTNSGKTVYHYELPEQGDDYNFDPHYSGPFPRDRGNYTPFLRGKDEYRNENGQYKLVRKTVNWPNMINSQTFNTGFNCASDLQILNWNGAEWQAFTSYNEHFQFDYASTFHYSDCLGYTGLRVLDQTDVYDYVDDVNFIKTTASYEYNEYAQVTSKTVTNSKGEIVTTNYKYPNDLPAQEPYQSMVNKNMLGVVVEESSFKNTNTFLQSLKTNYNFWDWGSHTWGNSSSNQIVPQTVETRAENNAPETRMRFHAYDDKGNTVSVSKENDVLQKYVWAYNKTYPIAHIVNAPDDLWAYSSFEDDVKGNWTVWGSYITTADPTVPTGKLCMIITGNNLYKGGLSTSAVYYVSYWYKAGSTVNVTGTSLDVITGQPKNGWTYVKRKITGINDLIISGNGYIDEVRFYPESAEMTTYAYEPLVGMTAQCDVNDRITYYEYDASGRLSLIKDDNRNILKRICYNYQGQPENCGINVTPIWQPTGATRCKPCPQNEAYISNIRQREEIDNNINSDFYGQKRWADEGAFGDCVVTPAWQYTSNTRCITINGQNTGEQEREQIDVNPCSNQPPRWINQGMNTAACPQPVVYYSQDVSGNYYSQNCGSTQIPLPYYVSMPAGSYTSSSSTEAATQLARADCQQRANTSGGCTTIYIRVVRTNEQVDNTPGSEHGYADFEFRFYSDPAGTVSMATPSPLVINYTRHEYETENGVPVFHAYTDFTTDAYTGLDKVTFTGIETLVCSGTFCYNQEYQLRPGRYVIIP